MPKMKTRKAARKRFQVTKNGKIKATRANKRHILTKKSTKRKRQLRRQSFLQSGDAGLVKVLLPNG
ncbi:50S ribosomal protein L35 [Myxococcota bacterium]|jgi:large subunit ribosomal protein L35|nr:50S ribosomal protein L35 [Myxococcota bacterium]